MFQISEYFRKKRGRNNSQKIGLPSLDKKIFFWGFSSHYNRASSSSTFSFSHHSSRVGYRSFLVASMLFYFWLFSSTVFPLWSRYHLLISFWVFLRFFLFLGVSKMLPCMHIFLYSALLCVPPTAIWASLFSPWCRLPWFFDVFQCWGFCQSILRSATFFVIVMVSSP